MKKNRVYIAVFIIGILYKLFTGVSYEILTSLDMLSATKFGWEIFCLIFTLCLFFFTFLFKVIKGKKTSD